MYAVLLSPIVVQLLQIYEAKSIVRTKGGEGKCLELPSPAGPVQQQVWDERPE